MDGWVVSVHFTFLLVEGAEGCEGACDHVLLISAVLAREPVKGGILNVRMMGALTEEARKEGSGEKGANFKRW